MIGPLVAMVSAIMTTIFLNASPMAGVCNPLNTELMALLSSSGSLCVSCTNSASSCPESRRLWNIFPIEAIFSGRLSTNCSSPTRAFATKSAMFTPRLLNTAIRDTAAADTTPIAALVPSSFSPTVAKTLTNAFIELPTAGMTTDPIPLMELPSASKRSDTFGSFRYAFTPSDQLFICPFEMLSLLPNASTESPSLSIVLLGWPGVKALLRSVAKPFTDLPRYLNANVPLLAKDSVTKRRSFT